MHAQMQEAHSMRQLELAKSTNIDKLVSGCHCATILSLYYFIYSLCTFCRVSGQFSDHHLLCNVERFAGS